MKGSRPASGRGATRPARINIRLNFSAYPIQSSLGPLGKKWALLVLMNIALSRAQRFNELLRGTPGMSKRILALRLRELADDGFICRVDRGQRLSRWQLTQKGADLLPVLLTLIHFGSRRQAASDGPGSTGTLPGRAFQVTYSGARPSGGPDRLGPESR